MSIRRRSLSARTFLRPGYARSCADSFCCIRQRGSLLSGTKLHRGGRTGLSDLSRRGVSLSGGRPAAMALCVGGLPRPESAAADKRSRVPYRSARVYRVRPGRGMAHAGKPAHGRANASSQPSGCAGQPSALSQSAGSRQRPQRRYFPRPPALRPRHLVSGRPLRPRCFHSGDGGFCGAQPLPSLPGDDG